MPRIVKPGKLPEPTPPWQTTTPFRCPICGCEWYAEGTEWRDMPPMVAMHGAHAHNDAGCAGMECPTCGKYCEIREPGKPIMRGL